MNISNNSGPNVNPCGITKEGTYADYQKGRVFMMIRSSTNIQIFSEYEAQVLKGVNVQQFAVKQ